MNRFIVVDPDLYDFAGHYFEYSVSIAEAASRLELSPVILTNQLFEKKFAPGKLEMIPTFPRQSNGLFPSPNTGSVTNPLRWKRTVRSIIAKNPLIFPAKFIYCRIRKLQHQRNRRLEVPDEFGSVLNQSLKNLSVGRSDSVFVHNLAIQQLEEILYLVSNYDHEKRPHFHLLLRRDPSEPAVTQAAGLGLARILEKFENGKLWPQSVSFYSDTEELAAHYSGFGKIRFSALPIPIRHDLAIRQSVKQPSDFIRVAYLGGARPEKGYHQLPGIIERFLEMNSGNLPQVCFVIQSNFDQENAPSRMDAARKHLKNLGDRVHLLTDPLKPDEYYRILGGADIVLIPYEKTAYAARSSGVLNEAFVAGKPVIVPAGTWMAKQIDPKRGLSFEKYDQIPELLTQMIQSLDGFKSAALAFQPKWREKNSPDALVRALISQQAVD